MKLSEIEAHVYLKKAVEPKFARVFQEPEEIKFIDYPVYTAEQMQEYAKAKVLEAYQNILNYAMFAYLNNHEPIVPEAQEVINTIFEEDTKND